ncbi:HAD family hydrolase, partial [Acinetobacter baumannii]|uniref:HAD family hydrolase n=1 Tax=Acinetobacter baumannii TaxID=470 RepID=UPI0031F38C89
KKEEAVYIGDSEVDVMTGKNAGMDVISVLWGYRTREQLIEAGAVVLVKDTEELESVLLK